MWEACLKLNTGELIKKNPNCDLMLSLFGRLPGHEAASFATILPVQYLNRLNQPRLNFLSSIYAAFPDHTCSAN